MIDIIPCAEQVRFAKNGTEKANQAAEGIEHHLNPKTIKQLRKFVTFLKSNPKFRNDFSEF